MQVLLVIEWSNEERVRKDLYNVIVHKYGLEGYQYPFATFDDA